MANKYALCDITSLKNRKVFFDANVLIYLFWPSGAYSWENSYSTAFKRLLRQQNEILVDFIIISEIVNRSHRLEYNKYLSSNNILGRNFSYKHYRDSQDGESALADIYLIIETNILPNFSVIGKNFSKSDIQSFLTLDTLDIADKGILSTCREYDCLLLTNDADFKSADIDILSSNPAILNYS